MLTGLVDRVRRGLGADVHGDAVSLARALVYGAVAGTLLANRPRMLLAPSGGPPDDLEALALFRSEICTGYRTLTAHCLPPPEAALTVQVLLGVALLVVGVTGWRPRWTCLPAAWVIWSSAAFGQVVGDGGDRLATILALLLVPLGLTDDRRFAWSRFGRATTPGLTGALVARYALALAAVQMAVVYGHSLVTKLAMGIWREGSAVYYIAHDPSEAFGSVGTDIIPWLRHAPVSLTVTWGTLVIEGVLVLGLLLARRHRRWLLVPGVALHLAIGAAMGLTSFALVMVAGLVLYGWPLPARPAPDHGAGGPEGRAAPRPGSVVDPAPA